uniref:Uncharacterized protein n=1 Tax=uncultured marine group II/III euryarchaeote KM3_35_G08 TaxID=1456438 RepID=A0A075GZP5_9EURY|nr:hypothetical protein [uncultured marine group II/III euryarchaeote KM3_35_G08]
MSVNAGIPGRPTPATLSIQKQRGQPWNASSLERLIGNGSGAFAEPNMDDSRERRFHFLRFVVAIAPCSFEALSTHLAQGAFMALRWRDAISGVVSSDVRGIDHQR